MNKENKETKTENIYQKMSAIAQEIKTVGKNLKVDTGNGGSYKAVSEKDILEAVKEQEYKHGVFSYPYNRKIVESELQVIEKSTYKTNRFYLRLEIVYRFVNIENPTEFIDIVSYGDGLDNGDKATGKAMTYADKYALMKAYKIETGEDPDKNPSLPEKITPAKPVQVEESYDNLIKKLSEKHGKTIESINTYFYENYDLENPVSLNNAKLEIIKLTEKEVKK
jgi:hypothetical protein